MASALIQHVPALPAFAPTSPASPSADEKFSPDLLATDAYGPYGEASRSVPGFQPDLDFTEAEEKAVKRKLDLFILPVCMILFMFMSLDRSSVANALTDNLLKDISATADQLNLAQVLFILGFVVMELPMSFAAKRFGPHRALPIWGFGWGVSVIGQGFINNPQQLMATRFLIGFFEAGFIPQTAFYLGRFYKTRELAVRYAIFWQSNSLASIMSGALATGILTLRGTDGHPGWRYLWWIEGAMTVGIAALALLLLPAGPAQTKGGLRGRHGYFTERQTAIAVTRIIRDDPTKVNEQTSRKTSLADYKATFSNFRLYFHLAIAFGGALILYPFSTYSVSLIKQIGGFNKGYTANAAAIPGYVISFIVSVSIAWSSDRHNERGLHIAFGCAWAAVGCFWLALPPDGTNPFVLYGGVLMTQGGAAVTSTALNAAFLSNNIPSPQRPIALAALLMTINSTGFFQVATFPASAAPRYRWPLIMCGCTSLAAGVIAIVLKFVYRRWPYGPASKQPSATSASAATDSVRSGSDIEK